MMTPWLITAGNRGIKKKTWRLVLAWVREHKEESGMICKWSRSSREYQAFQRFSGGDLI